MKTFESGSSVSYSVPATSYAVTVTARAGRPCYVVVKSLKTALDLFASTIQGGATQSESSSRAARQRLRPSPAVRRCRSARTASIVGTVPVLEYAFTYTFNPTNS